MKKIYLSLSLIFASVASFAQITLIDPTTGLEALTSYTFAVAPNSPTETHEFQVKNNYSTPVTVRAKRYLIENTAGQEPFFCFGTQCYSYTSNAFYSPSTSTSTMQAGGTLPSGQGTYGLTTDFDDFGFIGTSKVLYVIYDVNNVNDSVAMEITYDVAAVGLTKLDAKNFSISNPMPNPAVNTVALKYNFASLPKSSFVKIYNMVGVLVKEVKIDGVEGKTQVDITGLTEGVYFYSLLVNDKTVTTKRLVVSK